MILVADDKGKANYQDLLKTLAIIAMIADHLGLFLYPDLTIMRVIGRNVMPVFCFFAGYNFHDKPKHKIGIWGALLAVYTIILFKQFITTNILIPIYLGQCYLYYFRNSLTKLCYRSYCHIILVALLWYFTGPLIDYGTLGIAIMVLGYIAKHDRSRLKLCCFMAIIISLAHSIVVFKFSDYYLALTIIFSIFTYLLMIIIDFNRKIPINLKIISRNALHIYVIHLAIIEFICVYLYTYGFKNW